MTIIMSKQLDDAGHAYLTKLNFTSCRWRWHVRF